MRTHPRGGPALGRELGELTDLDRRRRCAVEVLPAGDGDHREAAEFGIGLAVLIGLRRLRRHAEEDHLCLRGDLDACHPRGVPSLRTQSCGVEGQQLGVRGHEHGQGVVDVLRLCEADDGVLALEGDDIPFALVRPS